MSTALSGRRLSARQSGSIYPAESVNIIITRCGCVNLHMSRVNAPIPAGKVKSLSVSSSQNKAASKCLVYAGYVAELSLDECTALTRTLIELKETAV